MIHFPYRLPLCENHTVISRVVGIGSPSGLTIPTNLILKVMNSAIDWLQQRAVGIFVVGYRYRWGVDVSAAAIL